MQDTEGSTPLHCALDLKAVELIEILIASGRIDWTLGTKKKPSVLQLAIGANVNEYISIYPALQLHLNYITFSLHLRVIEILLKDYENLLFNWTSGGGSTVLHLACVFGNFRVIKTYIKKITLLCNTFVM